MISLATTAVCAECIREIDSSTAIELYRSYALVWTYQWVLGLYERTVHSKIVEIINIAAC